MIKLHAKELLTRTKTAIKVVASKNSMPILGCAMLETRGNNLVITTSDGEQWLSQKCPMIECDQEARFCVNATDFMNAIANICDVPITITIEDGTHTITCDYGSGRFSMPYEDADEFPTAKTPTDGVASLIADGKKVLKAIELTGFATANDDLRPIMNGVHFDFFADGMVCATSDGLKLARYKDKSIIYNGENGETPSFTLPKKPANILMSLLSASDGDIKFTFSDKTISVNNKDFMLTARLLEFKYPNYNAVIPSSSPIIITANRDTLLNALKRVIPMASDTSCLVEFNFTQGKVTISAKDIDYSKSASETIACDCDTDVKIGFKGSTLVTVLRNINDDEMVIELENSSRAGVFYSALGLTREEYLVLCMPMLIQ